MGMADLSDLIGRLPLDRIAQSLGVEEATARNGVEAAVPALAGGMEANAQDAAGAERCGMRFASTRTGFPTTASTSTGSTRTTATRSSTMSSGTTARR